MRCLGRLIGLVLVLIFVGVFPCSLWTFNMQRIMVSGSTYKDAFKDEDFYQDLRPAVLPALLEDLENTSEDEVTLLQVINQLDRRDWAEIAPQLVPLEWVQYAVDTNLDSFFAWLDGDASDLNIIFRTEALRRRLSGPPGEAAVQMIANALPECSADESDRMADYVAHVEGSVFPYCRPQDSALQESLLGILNNARMEAAQALPADIDVIAEMREAGREHTNSAASKPLSDAELNRFRSSVRLWTRLLLLTLMIPLALLALIVIFAVRSSKLFFRWMGWSLTFACLLTLAPLFLLPFIVSGLDFEAEVEGGFAAGGTLIAHIVSSRMAELMIGQFTWPVLGQSAVLLLVGFAFAVISVLLPDPDAPPETMTAPYTTLPVYQTPSGPVILQEVPARLENTPPPDHTPPGGKNI